MGLSILQYAILGLGAGSAYALSGLGIVVTYRGSGVLNFAHGAIGMLGAYIFYKLWGHHTPWPIALLVAFLAAAAVGAGVHLLVMKPLRNAPPITHLIATLALFSLLIGLGELIWGYYHPSVVSRLIPAHTLKLSSTFTLTSDRLILFGIGLVLTAAGWYFYRTTKFGLATTSVAESRRATSAVGLSPDRIAAVNWALGSVLAVLATVLITSISSVLQVETAVLIVIPALGAALIGGFRSFWLTVLGGLVIGILDSEGAYLQVRFPSWPLAGWAESVPFVVIIIVMVVRGRSLPLRSELVIKPPRIGTGRIRPMPIVAGLVLAGLLAWYVLSRSALNGLITSCATGLIILSVVVITGYAGQLSLAQFAIAGVGGWAGAQLVANHVTGDLLASIIVLIGVVPLGVVVGLPALRTRGVNLAVVTLGLASILGAQFYDDEARSGGISGLQTGSAKLFGINVDSTLYPQRYAILSLVVLALGGLLVANLRRSSAGRQLLAVRSNERGAASVGIPVGRSKLYAFSVSAVLAAMGGLLLTFSTPTPSFSPQFDQVQSIFVVVLAVIGGIGFVFGSVIGGIIAPAALMAGLFGHVTHHTWIGPLFNNPEVGEVLLGVVVFDVLRRNPDGVVAAGVHPAVANVLRRVSRLLVKPAPAGGEPWGATSPQRADATVFAPSADDPTDTPSRAGSGTNLTCRAVTVYFGGVRALNEVSLEIRAGEVLGVIGANGAGKTTLLDVITGFVRPSSGSIALNGQDITAWSAHERAMSGIRRSFQGLELFETMTVGDNIAAASQHPGILSALRELVVPRPTSWTSGAETAIADFHLADVLDSKPEDLSYGQRRLVAIARAAAGEPNILLLDEPAAGLDPFERAELATLVREFASRWGVGVLLVEHDVEFVMGCSDRMVALDFGTVIAAGRPAEVRADEKVIAAYLGLQSDTPAHVTGTAELAHDPAGRADAASHDLSARPAPEVRPRPAAAPAGPILEIRGLHAGYGGQAVVRGLDLAVNAGEVVVLLGANGAGKTTTLLTIAGELRALGGSMTRFGETKPNLPLHHLAQVGLGFVTEERCITAGLTTEQNLRLGAGSIDEALRYFPELEPLMDRPAGLLSGGEQRILALARVLAADPKLLLADELSLGLAPQIVERLLGALRRAASSGVGVLLVEQHAQKALDIADRYTLLKRGEMVGQGYARDVRDDWGALAASYLSDSETNEIVR